MMIVLGWLVNITWRGERRHAAFVVCFHEQGLPCGVFGTDQIISAGGPPSTHVLCTAVHKQVRGGTEYRVGCTRCQLLSG